MPYNTRRKSLSLPSLGIQLPQSSRSHHHTPPSSAKTEQHPSSKRVKREYSPSTPLPYRHHHQGRYDPTPPPSPPPESNINYAEISDTVVAGVVRILEGTGNRPMTVKELALSLAPLVNLVENSANPHAIISARLNAYLKRASTPTSPTLLKKELITTHPRRIYFYLTTTPRQPIPQHENNAPMQRRSVISPALSDEEEEELRRRSEMSPSPEVDLSSHELDDDADATDSGSLVSAITTMIARQRTRSPSNVQHNVMASPPLEGDEREFSQSAIYIERRRSSSRESSSQDEGSSKRAREEEYESESIVSDELLGYPALSSSPTSLTPAKRAREEDKTPDKNAHHQFEDKADLYSWGGEFERHLGSPESVELDELDHLLGF